MDNSPNSIVMILAQPILQLCLSQPGWNFQVSQLSLSTMPIPQEDEASTQNSTGDTGGGLAKEEPQKLEDSWERHQAMSEKTLVLGDLWMKGDEV